jgi:hypothetical protein
MNKLEVEVVGSHKNEALVEEVNELFRVLTSRHSTFFAIGL